MVKKLIVAAEMVKAKFATIVYAINTNHSCLNRSLN